MKLLHLYSSGLDSYIGYHMINAEYRLNRDTEYIPVYFDLKHRYNTPELQRAYKLFGNNLKVVKDLFNFKEIEYDNAHIPNRNAFLILGVISLFDPEVHGDYTVFINGLRDDRVNDNSPQFIERMNELVKTMYPDSNISIMSPFKYKMTKKDIVDWYFNYIQDKEEAKVDILKYTFSCYNPIDNDHCYSCKACFRRNVALYPYIKLPFKNQSIIDYYKNNLSQYDPDRQKAITEYLNYLSHVSNNNQ